MASVVTEEDKNNDTKSINRKLCDHLYLIVEKDGVWQMPNDEWEPGETIKEAATRMLLKQLSDDFEHFILGHGPIGHVENGDTRTFYLHTLRCDGDVAIIDSAISDYMWATKEEVIERLPEKEAAMCEEILMTLRPLNQWIYGGEPQECARAVSERAYEAAKNK